MSRAWCVVPLALLACAPRAENTEPSAKAEDPTEPAPHYRAHPEIAPDELGAPELSDAAPTDAGDEAASTEAMDCPMSEPPPAPAMRERIRSGPPITNYIPPEVIMRPIRPRAPCFRGCYAAGLARNPNLAGRIVTRFVVDLDGWVRKARIVEDELGDADVADCIRRAFVGLHYPEPEGGSVTVVYPLQFRPSTP